MKPFTTYEQQIELLENRGLIIDNKESATSFLEKEGYFNVINGYKDDFLANRKEEKYKKNTKFQDIIDIYNYDKNLRFNLLMLLLDIENTFKSIIAYEFAQQFGSDAYLDANNYSSANAQVKLKVSNFILSIKEQIEKNTTKDERQYDCIRHYKKNHTSIPIWVIFNYLTFGQISIFYSLLQPSTKTLIAKHISKLYNFELNSKDLYTFIRIFVNLRNICAHNQRIYDYTTKFTFSKNNELITKLQAEYNNCLHNINILLLIFYIFTTRKDFASFALMMLSIKNTNIITHTKINLEFINELLNSTIS